MWRPSLDRRQRSRYTGRVIDKVAVRTRARRAAAASLPVVPAVAVLALALQMLVASPVSAAGGAAASQAATRGDTGEPPGPQPARELRVSLWLDGAVTGGLAAILIGTELAKNSLAPPRCRWCASNAFDRPVRDALRWQATGTASALSYVAVFLAPVAMVGMLGLDAYPEGGMRRWIDDTLLVAEATMASGVLAQAVKYAVGRERPFVRALAPGARAQTSDPTDNNVSFFSEHASIAFTLATAAGTVASLRRYRRAPYVWAVGMALAALTGYLRIAADRHYLSDVLVGAGVGMAAGFALPYLHWRFR
jgi:membrane-associated phospholipid phosphatase